VATWADTATVPAEDLLTGNAKPAVTPPIRPTDDASQLTHP